MRVPGPVSAGRSALWLVMAVTVVLCLQGPRPLCAEDSVPVARTLLALYDGAREERPDATRIHRFAELPLNHLGFVLQYLDVRQGLPEPRQMLAYRGVLTWFAGPVRDGNALLAWAGHVAELDIRYVALGDLGADVTTANLALVNRVFAGFGVRHTGEMITPTRGTRIAHRDHDLYEAECRLDPMLPAYPVIAMLDAATRPILTLTTPRHEGGRATTLAALGKKGGYAAFNYEFCHQQAPLHRGRWLLEPFKFFDAAFGAERFPVPDVTTASGRRLFFSQVDAEGWANPSQIEGYRHNQALAADVVMRELIIPFPELPVTVDLRESEIEKVRRVAVQSRAVASRMLALPQVVRPGRRSVGTTMSRLDTSYPSISSLAALASAEGDRPALTPASSETAYVAGETGRVAFHALAETLARTETPRRLKAFNLNYHVYAGREQSWLQAVRGHLLAARATPLAPVTAGRYADIVDGFFTTRIARIGEGRWLITDRGALPTVRLDLPDGIAVDVAASSGVIGQRRYAGALYVALDETVDPVVLVTTSQGGTPRVPVMELIESRWLLRGLERTSGGLRVEASGFGPGEFSWRVPPGSYVVTARRGEQQLWRQTVDADLSGFLGFTVPVAAIDPVSIALEAEAR